MKHDEILMPGEMEFIEAYLPNAYQQFVHQEWGGDGDIPLNHWLKHTAKYYPDGMLVQILGKYDPRSPHGGAACVGEEFADEIERQHWDNYKLKYLGGDRYHVSDHHAS